jgi:hypothetical protein
VDDHFAIFMPYIWVDDPIAFASGREVYGFAKTQGWMRRLEDPRRVDGAGPDDRTPDPPPELVLDVYGVEEFGRRAEVARQRLITIYAARRRRSEDRSEQRVLDDNWEGDDLASLAACFVPELEPSSTAFGAAPRRSLQRLVRPAAKVTAQARVLGELLSEQVVRHVFLKQIRDAENGELAALQQVVEARSRVVGGSVRWRRLPGPYELTIAPLASHPLQDDLGLPLEQTIRLAFAAEFGFRMEPGVVRWP